jgi:hypothetical protein
MNTRLKTPGAIQPIVLLLALSIRVRQAFGEVFESTSRIIMHARAQVALQASWSGQIKAIDDPLEATEPLLCKALENDSPAIRSRILAAWRETHRRSESLASSVDAKCPAHLLAD